MASVSMNAPSNRVDFVSRRQLDVIRLSALRQLKTRYRGTLLGVLWSFANPLLMTGLYAALFGTTFSAYYGGSIVRYLLSAFVAVVVVTFFSQTTAEGLVSVVSNGALLNKIAVDPETFPIATVVANTAQQAVTTFLLILLLSAAITHDPLRVVLVPVVLAALIAMIAGFTLFLATLFVFFRDVSHFWAVISFIFWMTSPVFYPPEVVPARVRIWFDINPIGLAIAALRNVTIARGAINVAVLGEFVAVALLIGVAGHVVFRKFRPHFMDML